MCRICFSCLAKGFVFCVLLIGFNAKAQYKAVEGVRFLVIQRPTVPDERTFLLLLKVENPQNQTFRGFIRWNASGAFQSLKGDSIYVEVESHQQRYISLPLTPTANANAGKNIIRFALFDHKTDRLLEEKEENLAVEERIQLHISAQEEEIIVYNPLDSVKITLNLTNTGNTEQEIDIVYNFPVPLNGQQSFRQSILLYPRQDSLLTFRFLIPPISRQSNEFRVQVTAVGGSTKQVLGYDNIIIKNVKSSSQYHVASNDLGMQFNPYRNGVSLSRRQQGNLTTYQLYGGSAVNLHKGMLALNGNLSYNINTGDLYASGTSLRYGLEKLEIELGSITNESEMNLFGRGIKASLYSSDNQDKYTIGVIDNQFNPVSTESLFNRGFTLFGETTFGVNNMQKQWTGQFAFKRDPYEDLQSQLFSLKLIRMLSTNYLLEIRGHGAISQYQNLHRNRGDGAIEFIQRGRLKNWHWSGNYYFSTAYFPGVRRGTWFINHTMNKQLRNSASVWGNFYFAHFAPKSYIFQYDYNNRNMRGEIGIRFPKKKQIGTSLRMQYEEEKSDNYNYLLPTDNNAKIEALRLVEDLNWQSPNYSHTVYVSLENGFARYPFANRLQFQSRGTISYTFGGVQMMGYYQRGAYYLSEYLSRSYTNAQTLERITLNASYFQNFFQNRLETNIGFGYFDDLWSSRSPTGYANTSYAVTNLTRVFLNANWYQYSYTGELSNHITSIEGGLRVAFANRQISSKKKGYIEITCFYDENSNDIWDEGEQVAGGVTIAVNNEIFISDKNGKVRYSMLPYGTYVIHGGIKGNWYFKMQEIQVSSRAIKRTIPLQQTGTLTGNIRYMFDQNLANNIEAKFAGIAVIVTRADFSKRIVTDSDGNFTVNLPKGDYFLQLDQATLPDLVTCENPIQEMRIATGKINKTPTFILNVQNRKIRLKRFSGNTTQ